MAGVFDQIAAALSGKPMKRMGAGTNQKVPQQGDFSQLYAGKLAQMKKMGMNPDGTPIKTNPLVSPRVSGNVLRSQP